MKTTVKTFGILFLLILFGSNVNAQSGEPELIVLLNKADWCGVCKSNGPRVEKDLMPMLMKNKEVQVVMNDLSNKKTISKSKTMLEKAGMKSIADKNKGTGTLYFIDAKSKKPISNISIAKSNEEIMAAYKKALEKYKMPVHSEKGHSCTKACMSNM